MNLRDLVETIDLPPTSVSERAWELARQRERRRRVAGLIAGVGTAAVTVVALMSLVPRGTDPEPPPVAPSPTDAARGQEEIGPAITWPRPWTGRPWAQLASAPELVVADVTDLSRAPLPVASLAITDPSDPAGVLVLGEDGRWRRVDTPLVAPRDDGDHADVTLRSGSLSPDATRLALPQPGELVVVDLPSGTVDRYQLPGLPMMVGWVDRGRVLVWTEESPQGMLVDLRTGDWSESERSPSTAFLPDGGWVSWGPDPLYPTFQGIEWSDGTTVVPGADNSAGYFPQPPLVDGEILVGHTSLSTKWPGAVVVDGRSGLAQAYLPLRDNAPVLLGWSDDEVLVTVRSPSAPEYAVIARWDWRAGPDEALVPVVRVPEGRNIVWGTGVLTDAPMR